MVTFEKLEAAFATVIERNRKEQTLQPCPREALFAPAFFHIGRNTEPPEVGIVPNKLPFETIWLVTNFKGLAICAYCERMSVAGVDVVRPDYLWYPERLAGEALMTTESEMHEKVAFIIDRALHALLTNHLAEVDSQVREMINRRRMKARNNPLPDLPPFIRVTDERAVRNEPKGGTHSSPQPHNRRGHWRTYRKSGKMVWINETKVLGGSPVARNYHVDVTVT